MNVMGERDAGRRRRLEGVIPDILKRAVEVGVEKAQDAPQNIKTFIHDLKLPKEIATYIFSQVDETKTGVVRVVANEMRDFLEHTNISGELQKLLTTVQFEINTTIRFRPNEPSAPAADSEEAERSGGNGGDEASRASPMSKPEVKTQVHVSRAPRRERRRQSKIGEPPHDDGVGGKSGGEPSGGTT
jgi:hypothetical protein